MFIAAILNLSAILDSAAILVFDIVMNILYILDNILVEPKMNNICQQRAKLFHGAFFSFWGTGCLGGYGDPLGGILWL